MTQEEKQLLLKDLCARLPYGVKLYHKQGVLCNLKYVIPNIGTAYVEVNGSKFFKTILENGQRTIYEYKPYLRPMSSMTEEEDKEFQQVIEIELKALEGPDGHTIESAASSAFEIDFYNKHHFDYRGLISMGLALEAPEDMYK